MPLVNAQSVSTLIGARAMSLGYASSCLKDEWALFNNPAGIAKITQPVVSFTYDAFPALSSFNRMAACYGMPAGPGVTALGVYRFGDDLYNEQLLTAAYANTLGIASLGIKVSYIQYHAEGFGNAGAFTVSFGGIAQLTPVLSIGAHIININQPNLTKLNEESLPTTLLVGMGFVISDKLFLTSEVEKDLSYEFTWKSGLEYKLHKRFVARTGFSIQPQAGFGGLEWKTKKFVLSYAFQYSFHLGASHQASVSYQFKTEK
jgi:hypothetical protein